MRKSRAKLIAERAVTVAISAVEIYNKPRIEYREESFSILMLNAWELLLKARLIELNEGDLRSVYVFENAINKDGSRSLVKRRKLNQSGNAMSIGFKTAVNRIRQYSNKEIDDNIMNNLLLLQEIRDNAIHFYDTRADFRKCVHEVASAAVKNFFVAVENWFAIEVDSINVNLTPIGLYSVAELSESIIGGQESSKVQNLLNLISAIENSSISEPNSLFCTTLQLKLEIVRHHDKNNFARVQVANDDPNAIPITMKEDDVLKNFSWDYKMLTNKLRERYVDFKLNQRFHSCRKAIEKNNNFSRTRYLDPKKKSGSKKTFYNPGIFSEFDKHYERKTR